MMLYPPKAPLFGHSLRGSVEDSTTTRSGQLKWTGHESTSKARGLSNWDGLGTRISGLCRRGTIGKPRGRKQEESLMRGRHASVKSKFWPGTMIY